MKRNLADMLITLRTRAQGRYREIGNPGDSQTTRAGLFASENSLASHNSLFVTIPAMGYETRQADRKLYAVLLSGRNRNLSFMRFHNFFYHIQT